jgi:hypothetical protein
MRFFEIVAASVIASVVAVAPADAQRYRPSDYAAPFTPAWAAPQLVVTPEFGPPGTEVQISGARFHRGVQVFYGDRPMEIIAIGKQAIVAVIPWGVRGADYIYVVDNTGRARTDVPFAIERAGRPYYRGPYRDRYREPYRDPYRTPYRDPYRGPYYRGP